MMDYRQHLQQLLSRELERWIAWFLPLIIRRSFRQNLHGIWVKEGFVLPSTGAILAPNHRSWWDLYLAWWLHVKLGRKASGMMHSEQLARFRFFRHIGMIAQHEVREAIRRLRAGQLLFVFPEGELRSSAEVTSIHKGMSFLAAKAAVPVVPVVFRVVMRGAQLPEAYLIIGRPVMSKNRERLASDYLAAINQLLRDFEQDLLHSDPEQPLVGYQTWFVGKSSFHSRMLWLRRWWQ
jgi:1-acyl-sn-glycerol-3-phosphate acyltransferase